MTICVYLYVGGVARQNSRSAGATRLLSHPAEAHPTTSGYEPSYVWPSGHSAVQCSAVCVSLSPSDLDSASCELGRCRRRLVFGR
jgi:hypothetical protein